MTTFKDFLIESTSDPVGSKLLSREKTIELLKSGKYDDALNGVTKIYRGMNDNFSKTPFFLMDPSKHHRVSANTNNFYNYLMSEYLTNWKDFPKRSRSLICSTSEESAEPFGQVYVVLPQNGSNVGVCSASDLWLSFDNTLQDFNLGVAREDPGLDKFNKIFAKIATYYTRSLASGHSIEATLKTLDKEIKATSKLSNEELSNFVFDSTREGYDVTMRMLKYCRVHKIHSVYELLEQLLDPIKNEIYVANAGDSLPHNREVWTSGICLCIRITRYETLLAEIAEEEK